MPETRHRLVASGSEDGDDACRMLTDYWQYLRHDRAFPAEADIDPDAIADIWPSCFLISLDPVTHRLDYRYSYLGEKLLRSNGSDTDVALRFLSHANAPLANQFAEVMRRKSPVIRDVGYAGLEESVAVTQICMIPLGTDASELTHILGYMRLQSLDTPGTIT